MLPTPYKVRQSYTLEWGIEFRDENWSITYMVDSEGNIRSKIGRSL